MRNTEEDNKLIASLAVFRELFNSEKDIYGVISVFLSEIIKNQALYSFTLSEITTIFNKHYEFDIPSAVVNTSLGRLDFIEKKQGSYIVNNTDRLRETIIDTKQNEISQNNEHLIQNLFRFIEKEKEIKLADKEKEIISHSFCSFLLDETNGNNYIEYITTFILQNESDINFKNQLNLIREGVILYSGIKYSSDLNDLGTWRTEMTIFVETEILFHLAGYNGELYRTIVLDFLSYVKEINQKAKRKIIHLKYFRESKNEIEGFFTKAKYLVEGSRIPNPRVTAMVTIVNGCKKPSDVLEKKSDFYTLIRSHTIEEDNYGRYFDEENYKYNIVSQDLIDKISKEIDKDSNDYLNFLNYISIHRREANPNNFENIRVILLTGNSVTLKVAFNDLLKDIGHVPLATHLSFLTNKFWFKLNKGFGKTNLPKSFDIISKSQMVLSKVLSDTVGDKYNQLQEQFKNGVITEEQVKSRLLDLRNQVRRPEDIKNDVAKDILYTITSDSLEKFIEQQSYIQNEAKNQAEENVKLKEELIVKKDVEIQLLNTKKEVLNEKIRLVDTLNKQKEPLDKMARSKYQTLKISLCIVIVLYYISILVAIYIYGWDTLEKFTYILALFPIVLSLLFLIIFEKNINPIIYLQNQKQKYFSNTYAKFNFDIEDLKSSKLEIIKLTQEIAEIESASR